MSGLPVRDGFERYGGDAYFNEHWRPVMIVDHGRGDLVEDFHQKEVIVRPGDQDWERTKFRFRSSVFSLVTMVDHLYFVHLQCANFFVTSLREQMSESHPIRRFLTPFTYQTISVNDNAKHNLIAQRTMGPRCFALTDKGFELGFAAAPSLQVWGYEVPKSEGGPCLTLKDYFAYKKKSGVDTEYFRQASEIYEIYCRFLRNYLDCYYSRKQDLVHDEELFAMAQHYFIRYEAASASSLGRLRRPWIEGIANDANVDKAYDFYVNWLASLMWMVTAGHEQMGAVEVYAQDASWTAFKWTPGSMCGTKQTATAQALLMSFTSTPMPKLMGEDWSHLFPKTSVLVGKSPESAFKTFQDDLTAMAAKCEKFNAEARSRNFPDCFPVYTNNPRVLECAVSVWANSLKHVHSSLSLWQDLLHKKTSLLLQVGLRRSLHPPYQPYVKAPRLFQERKLHSEMDASSRHSKWCTANSMGDLQPFQSRWTKGLLCRRAPKTCAQMCEVSGALSTAFIHSVYYNRYIANLAAMEQPTA